MQVQMLTLAASRPVEVSNEAAEGTWSMKWREITSFAKSRDPDEKIRPKGREKNLPPARFSILLAAPLRCNPQMSNSWPLVAHSNLLMLLSSSLVVRKCVLGFLGRLGQLARAK